MISALAFADELEGVQLEARLTGQLRIEAPVKVGQGGALVQTGLFEAALVQT